MREFIPFRDRLAFLARARWLRKIYLYRLLVAFAVQIDALVDWAILALLARYPQYAPPDALPVLGRERGIRRGFDEPLSAYATRLLSWLVDRKIKGSPYALMSQLAGYFAGHSIRLRVVNAAGTWYTRYHNGSLDWHYESPSNWDWDGDASPFSRYWVILHVPTSLWSKDGKWGSPGKWGDGGKWGLSATDAQAQTILAIIRDWNPPHATCAGILVTWDYFAFDPTDPAGTYGLPDGHWYQAGKVDGTDYVLARPINKRFTGAV